MHKVLFSKHFDTAVGFAAAALGLVSIGCFLVGAAVLIGVIDRAVR